MRAGDARNLRWLADRVGDRFVAGVLLYTGDRVVALGDRITLLPISSLWAAPHDGGETPDAGR